MVAYGVHDSFLIALSIFVAIFASFTALDLAGRIRLSEGWVRRLWISAAAVALGGGIWSTHFVAMLAFSIPGVVINYDLGLTLLSLALAILFTSGGFAIIGWRKPLLSRATAGGFLMGAGILAMHFVGMAAMRMLATPRYEPSWLVISGLIAIGAATAAVWLAAREQTISQRVIAAIVMGGAIAGMHYAGMRAAIFTATAPADVAEGLVTQGHTYLAISLSGITAVILLLALGAARLDRLFSGIARREAQIALRLKVADILRSASSLDALNEIAALMGTHFGVTRTGYGELNPDEDVFNYQVCWTNETVPPLLGSFPAAAFGVKIVAALKAGETIVVEDLLEAPISDEAQTRETAREVDTRSILVVPFVREGRLRSIVYLNDRNPRQWGSEDISFMEELAERTRLVIERDAVEAKLRELNATLEARVAARTAELRDAQEALLQSQKMEAVGQLVSGIAHDFNNVLGAAMGALELVRRRAEQPERVRKFAEAGLQAVERGAKLTAQLLAFSRSQSIQLQPILVCDVIENVRDLLARTAGPMIKLELRLNPAPPAVLADPTQVEMMVLNLVINARDAMPDGGALTISTQVCALCGDPDLADADYVEVAVSDTGTGMDAATLRRAMDPFFTTKTVGKGTGLGLSQIYGSARQSGGTVRIESALGIGTTVRVLLPCTQRNPIRLMGDDEFEVETLDRCFRVLIVDDDADHRELLAHGLEALGHSISRASDGPSALVALRAKVPDVLLLDFAMPGMNGAEVAREVRRNWPELPIIFTSGFADTGAIQAIEGENVTILRKPFRMAELQRALRKIEGHVS